MARSLTSISSRMILAVIAIHAVLLPPLTYGLLKIVRDGQEEAFIDHARIYTRVFADIFETSVAFDLDEELVLHLDSAILGSRGIYATLEIDNRLLTSSIMQPGDASLFVEDFDFGEHGDNIYYLSAPLQMADKVAILKLGFDEGPTVALIESARRNLLYFVLAYLLVSILLAVLLSTLLAKSLRRLRQESRKIASGDYDMQLSVVSNIYEVRELSRDLEAMRSNLVALNSSLQIEISDRQTAVSAQHKVEAQLHHLQRLQSIGTLAGGVAHEFNNILLPIILYTELANEDLPQDSPVRANLDRVIELANRAKGLSQQILMFGRQSGKSSWLSLDIAPVIEEALSMIRALIPANIEICSDIAQNAGSVFCDPNEIHQLIINLCSNAYLALRQGGGSISIGLELCKVDREIAQQHARLQVGEYLRLAVIDTGDGMSDAVVARIFEPFFTTREVGQGTGLGLSVVHGIVMKHDGDIIVSSAPGRGTTFLVYLPIAGTQTVPMQKRVSHD